MLIVKIYLLILHISLLSLFVNSKDSGNHNGQRWPTIKKLVFSVIGETENILVYRKIQ